MEIPLNYFIIHIELQILHGYGHKSIKEFFEFRTWLLESDGEGWWGEDLKVLWSNILVQTEQMKIKYTIQWPYQ